MSKKKDFNKPALNVFLSYFGAHKGLFILDMSCALLIAGIDIAFPVVSRYAMNTLLPDNMYEAFFKVMIIVTLAYVLRALFQFIITFLGHRFGILVEADIRADLYKHFQELDFDFYDKNRTGVLMSRLTSDLFELSELSHHGPEDIVVSFATIIGALIVMFKVEFRLALVVLIVLPIACLIVMVCRKSMTRASKNVKAKTGAINSDIESTISGMKTSKAFDNDKIDYERFDRSNTLFKDSKIEFHRSMAIFHSTLDFILCFLKILVLSVGGFLIMKGNVNYVDLITFMLYISAFVTPIRNIASLAETFTSGMAGLNRFMEIMRTKPSIIEKEDAISLVDVMGEIELNNVKFGYKKEVEVLHGINLDVKQGERIALVGHSGGGKSTICQLIPRFYDIESGSIKIDGVDIRDLTKSSIRRNIGIVQQDVFLFADTVLENIRYGRPDATLEEVIEASKKAEIFDDIMEMPDKFNTYVGERGTLLSGGQKQRISIARIFLKNPKILIFDEATSALDSITEALIQEAFEKLSKGRTTITIAHRLSTIKNSDRIVVIDNGSVIESGTHTELMNSKGMYSRLYSTQRLLG